MKKFTKTEGLPGGPNEVRVSGFYDQDRFTLSGSYGHQGDVFSTNINNRFVVGNNVLSNDINANLQAAILKGLTAGANANVSFNKGRPVRIDPNLSLNYNRKNFNAGINYNPMTKDLNISGGFNKNFKKGLNIRGNAEGRFVNGEFIPYIDFGASYRFDAGGHIHPHTYRRNRKIIEDANKTGYGTISRGQVSSEAELARLYPDKWHLPQYQALLNRDTRLVSNPGDYVSAASRLENADYDAGHGDPASAIGAIPVRFNEEGDATGYATGTSTAGYTGYTNRERQGVVNFPASAQLLYDMDQVRKGTSDVDAIQFEDEVSVGAQRPSWLPEGGLTHEVRNNMDTYQRNNPGMSREEAYKIATSEDGKAALKEYWDNYEQSTGNRIEGLSDAEAAERFDEPSFTEKVNDVFTNPFTVTASWMRGQDPWANSSMSINEQQNAARDIYEKTGDERFLGISGVQGRVGMGDAGVHILDDFVPTHHFQNAMDNYGSGRKTQAAMDFGLGVLSMTPVKTGSIIKEGAKYEAKKFGQAGLNLLKPSAYTGNTVKQIAKDQTANLLKTGYHGGKLTGFGSLFSGSLGSKDAEGKPKKQGIADFYNVARTGDENVGVGDYVGLGTNLINIANPFKYIPGSNVGLEYLSKSGKDLWKSGVYGSKALDSDSDTQTKNAIKSASYLFGAVSGGKNPLTKYIGKTINKQAGNIDTKFVEPAKQYVQNLLTPSQEIAPDDIQNQVIAEETGISADNRVNKPTTSLRFGGITNGPIEQINNQRKLMKAIVDSPRYIETLKKEFPNYSIEQILEERTNRLNSL